MERKQQYYILFTSGEESYKEVFNSEAEKEEFCRNHEVVPYMEWIAWE